MCNLRRMIQEGSVTFSLAGASVSHDRIADNRGWQESLHYQVGCSCASAALVVLSFFITRYYAGHAQDECTAVESQYASTRTPHS